MNAAQIVEWMDALGESNVQNTGNGWVHCSCPFAGWRHESGKDSNPSFGVRIEPGESGCYCLACDFGGSQYEILMSLREYGAVGIDYVRAQDLIFAAEDSDEDPTIDSAPYESQYDPKAPAHVYPEWLLDAFTPAYDDVTGDVHPYLKGRAMPYDVASHLQMRYDPYRDRVLFPVFDWRKRLRGLHGRAVELPCGGYTEWEKELAYKMYPYEGKTNPHIWLGENWVDVDLPIVVAESVFDLARVLEVYQNVISPLSASISLEKIKRIRGAEVIYTLFDADVAGKRASEKLDKNLPTTQVVALTLPAGKDAGEMTSGEVADLLAAEDLL